MVKQLKPKTSKQPLSEPKQLKKKIVKPQPTPTPAVVPASAFRKIHLTLHEAQQRIKKITKQIETEEVKNSKTKRKRLYHQLAQLKKAVDNPFEFLVDPYEEKRQQELDKQRRLEKKLQQAEERKKKEKNQERHKKRCLNCGSKDHILSECTQVESGFCYKCGSSEHTHTECLQEKFKFASCFVCNEKGHISRECPQNEKGLYRKGGSCFGCGSVRHTLKDCPKRHSSGKFVDQGEEF